MSSGFLTVPLPHNCLTQRQIFPTALPRHHLLNHLLARVMKTLEGQDYPSVPPEEQGWQEIVSNCLGPYLHHFMIPPTWEFLSFSAQQNFWARGLR